MKHSKITLIGKLLKSIFGIKNFSLFRKDLKKKIGRCIYRQKYTSKDIIAIMQNMGMKKGSVVCIHCSMKEFYNYHGTAKELLDEIINVITEDGTLIMPCFPKKELIKQEGYVFSKDDPTGAGYLAECFRKYPNVKRSINVQHSVAVWGKNADWFVCDHHKGRDCWDSLSPWYKLIEKEALVFNFGLPRSFIGTFRHCLESTLKDCHPYWSQFFTKEATYNYYDDNHEIKTYNMLETDIERRNNRKYPSKYFNSDILRIARISNLEIKVYHSKACFNKMIQLGIKGISPYKIPSTRGYKF